MKESYGTCHDDEEAPCCLQNLPLKSRVTDAVSVGQNVDGGVYVAAALLVRIFRSGFFRRLGGQAGGGPPDL